MSNFTIFQWGESKGGKAVPQKGGEETAYLCPLCYCKGSVVLHRSGCLDKM